MHPHSHWKHLSRYILGQRLFQPQLHHRSLATILPSPNTEVLSIFLLSFLRICLPVNLPRCLSARTSGWNDKGSLNFVWASGGNTAYTEDPY